jgi:hypothetical protein
MKIEDGKGGGHVAEVNDENELVTRSIVESELEHASINGDAFAWVSTDTDIDAGDTRLFIRNDSAVPLVLDAANFLPANVACDWSINIGTDSTTPTGTSVSAVNLNTSSGKDAEATAYDDETAVPDGSPVGWVNTGTTGVTTQSLDGIILGKNHWIQINQETESTSGRVTISGHFANPS